MTFLETQDGRLKAEQYKAVNIAGFPLCVSARMDILDPNLKPANGNSFIVLKDEIQRTDYSRVKELKDLLPTSGGPYLGMTANIKDT